MKTFTLSNDQPSSPGEPDFVKDLNPNQQDAVRHVNGPILIVAGAGSGKTRVLTYRIAYLLQQNYAQPQELLSLTFTNKAAREMQERIEQLIGEEARKIWMGTFHSIFSKILRFEAQKIGYNSDFTIYDTDDSESVIKQILRELNQDPKEIRPKIIRNKISSAKNQLIYPDQYAEQYQRSTLDEITGRVYKYYMQRLKQNNAMDFDDLLLKPIELFRNHPDVLEAYQNRFKYILIDEYQDTNHAQYQVTNMLAGGHKNLCVVGDDAQSIYSFRGADISNILNFKQDYPDAKQVPLEQNYRSTKAILQCADAVIKQNTQQLDKSLWTSNDFGDTITLLENFDERDEANRVANYIHEMKMRHGYGYNQFAILYRTNYQSRVFEDALRRKGIPYQLVGGLSFYQRKEIKDALAYLTLLINPGDEAQLLRIINEPPRGIGQKTVSVALSRARQKGQSLWNIIQHPEELNIYKPGQKKVTEFVELIQKYTREAERGTSIEEITRNILTESGYIQHLVEDNDPRALGRRDNIQELLNAISYYEQHTRNPSLGSFLQEISLITDTDKYDESKPAVTMMTVHASKGLEFPVIFIVGLEEGLFPVSGQNSFDVDYEEERRLFYVAITRAEKHLFFSHAKSRYKFGEEQYMQRSRFLNEVDEGVVRNESGSTIEKSNTNGSGTYVDYEDSDDGSSDSGFQRRFEERRREAARMHRSNKGSESGGTQIEYDDEVTSDSFQPGVQVIHPKFGYGKILQRSGTGDRTKVVVFFRDQGQKKLLLKFAKLRLAN